METDKPFISTNATQLEEVSASLNIRALRNQFEGLESLCSGQNRGDSRPKHHHQSCRGQHRCPSLGDREAFRANCVQKGPCRCAEGMQRHSRPSLTIKTSTKSTVHLPRDITVKTIEVHIGEERNCFLPKESSRRSRAIKMSSPNPNQSQGKLIGPTMELEPLLLDLAPGQTTQSGGTYRNLGGTPFLFDEANDSMRVTEIKRISKIEERIGSKIPSLVDIYQKTVHPSLPVVAAEDFSAQADRLDCWNPALLAAICTISETWLPNTASADLTTPPSSSGVEDLAFSFFSESLSRPTLPIIQAGLLLMQRPNIDAKRLNTQLVDAAYELGLQLDCSSWSISDEEKRLRKRLAWALYMQDKWCSLVHGRPSSISSDNWVVKPLVEDDFDPDSDAALDLGKAVFIHMTSLTEILTMVLDTFYTPKAMDEVQEALQSGTRLILDRAKPAQIRMKEWFSGLPAQLKLDGSIDGRGSASVGYLHLAYFSTEITLHRCIIRSLNNSIPADPYITYICRAAAKTRLISAMDFVNRLRPEHLSAFWYFPSRNAFALVGTFGALLRATAPGQEEANFYATRLREYRWTLAVSTRRAPFLQAAVQSLDDAEALLTNLPPKPTTKEIAEASAREDGEYADGREDDGIDYEEKGSDSEDNEDMDVDMPDGTSSGASVKSNES